MRMGKAAEEGIPGPCHPPGKLRGAPSAVVSLPKPCLLWALGKTSFSVFAFLQIYREHAWLSPSAFQETQIHNGEPRGVLSFPPHSLLFWISLLYSCMSETDNSPTLTRITRSQSGLANLTVFQSREGICMRREHLDSGQF